MDIYRPHIARISRSLLAGEAVEVEQLADFHLDELEELFIVDLVALVQEDQNGSCLLYTSLPPELAVRLYRVYGELATDALRDDPYVLTDPYFHADFSLVDAFALALDVAAEDERRGEAGILFELSLIHI